MEAKPKAKSTKPKAEKITAPKPVKKTASEGVSKAQNAPKSSDKSFVVFATGGNTLTVELGTAMEGLVPALIGLGHTDIKAGSMPLKANAVEIVAGRLVGGADPRSEGASASE